MNKSANIAIITGAAVIGAAVYLLLYKNRKEYNMKTTTTNNNSTLPRGYRNNNPLNIRYNSANKWQWAVAKNTDGTFEQFTTMAYGYRAALVLLRKYINTYGLHTVTEIINRWAPPTENNTSGYISRVIGTNGWTASTVIDADDKEQMCKLVYAMALVENGYSVLPNMNEIYQGWNLL